MQKPVQLDNAAIASGSGAYILWLQANGAAAVQVGKLGCLQMQSGWYCYIGSAMGPGGVAARVGHHCRIARKPRWHIDYLRAECHLRAVWYVLTPQRVEHAWVEVMASMPGAGQPLPGFGASDHRGATHLFRFASLPRREAFVRHFEAHFPQLAENITIASMNPEPCHDRLESR